MLTIVIVLRTPRCRVNSEVMIFDSSSSVTATKAVEIDSQNIDGWTYLGDSYIQLNKFDEALPAYEAVVRIDPKQKDIWEKLVELYIHTGNAKKEAEAEKMLKSL